MSDSIKLDPSRSLLLVVDMQRDFMPGGTLAVEEGDRIVEPIRLLMDAGIFQYQVATQDWHPPGHVSFASQHAGKVPFEVIQLYGQEQTLWPDHCVQGSQGARLHEGLNANRLCAILRKGMEPNTDSYSGFRNNWNAAGRRPPTGLAGYLRERGIDSVFCCGLARDVCVKWTAEDAAEIGFETFFICDLTRAVNSANDDRVRADLEAKGVRIISADRLTRK